MSKILSLTVALVMLTPVAFAVLQLAAGIVT